MDLAFVDLHIAPSQPMAVSALRGDACFLNDASERGADVEIGSPIHLGDLLFVEAGAEVVAGLAVFAGGRHGKAHSFVARDSMTDSPSRADVPRLVRDLVELEDRMLEHLGEDPLTSEGEALSQFEHAYASDFALQNLQVDEARLLPEAVARDIEAVALFLSGESMCVAATGFSVTRLRALMEALGRPVSPHIVTPETLRALMDGVYGPPNAGPSSQAMS